MTNEEMQRTMEFIVQQQAQFWTSILKTQESRKADAMRINRLEDSFQTLVQLAEATDARLDNLETRATSLEDNHTLLETNMAALAAAQAHADQRLSALIDIVIEGQNGRSKNT